MATDISKAGSKIKLTYVNGESIYTDPSEFYFDIKSNGDFLYRIPGQPDNTIVFANLTISGVAPTSVAAEKTAIELVFPDGGAGGAVTSVFSRTGDVTAQAGDYSSFYQSLGITSRTVGGTTDALLITDKGKMIYYTSNSDITLTVPVSLGTDFNCAVMQLGTGKITFTASGTTIINVDSFVKTKGVGAIATIASTPTANTLVTAGQMQA